MRPLGVPPLKQSGLLPYTHRSDTQYRLQLSIQMEKATGDATGLLIVEVSDSGTTVQTFLTL